MLAMSAVDFPRCMVAMIISLRLALEPNLGRAYINNKRILLRLAICTIKAARASTHDVYTQLQE